MDKKGQNVKGKIIGGKSWGVEPPETLLDPNGTAEPYSQRCVVGGPALEEGQTVLLFCHGAHDQPDPADEEAYAANRCDGAQPSSVGDRQEVERTREDQDTRQEAEPGPELQWIAASQDHEHQGMNEVVKHSFFPNLARSIADQEVFEPVSAEGSEYHCQPSEQRSQAKGKRICHWWTIGGLKRIGQFTSSGGAVLRNS